MAIIQVHWQNPNNLNETEFVAQSADLEDGEALMVWAKEVVDRRAPGEMPEGWHPLVCTEDAPMFMMAASPNSGRLID